MTIVPTDRQTELIDLAVEYLWNLYMGADDVVPDLAGMADDLDPAQARRWFAQFTDVRDAYLIDDLDYMQKFIDKKVGAPISPYWENALTRIDLFKEQQYKFKRAFGTLSPLR